MLWRVVRVSGWSRPAASGPVYRRVPRTRTGVAGVEKHDQAASVAAHRRSLMTWASWVAILRIRRAGRVGRHHGRSQAPRRAHRCPIVGKDQRLAVPGSRVVRRDDGRLGLGDGRAEQAIWRIGDLGADAISGAGLGHQGVEAAPARTLRREAQGRRASGTGNR